MENLVVIFLRGACDGLNIVPPIDGEDRALYEAARPTLAVPLKGDRAAIPLDARFGLHPAAKPLIELYRGGKLAIVHAAGLTSDTRSHFDAQNFMELGTPNRKAGDSGWITRYLNAVGVEAGGRNSFIRAIALGHLVPTSLMAYPSVAVINNLNGFNLTGRPDVQSEQRAKLRELYDGEGWVSHYGMETLEAIDALEEARPNDYAPANGADYPNGEIGGHLRSLAQLIKMGLGLRVATIDMGGWDTHKNQEGQFHNHLSQLSQALLAFYKDMQGHGSMHVVVMSEFGRRVKENASHGTDHGHGNIMMVLGEDIRGGKILGEWPGLRTEQLYDRADLAVTTDYREVLSELLLEQLGPSRIGEVFPGYSGARSLGLRKKT